MNPGGTEGGTAKFIIGCLLCVVSVWLFFDSVRVVSSGFGAVSGAMHGYGRRGGGAMETTSMGIIFVPFFIGLVALFYNARLKWGWVLFWVGLAIVIIEMVSRLRFRFDMKSSHLMMMIVMFAAGAGLALKGLREERDRNSGAGGVESEPGSD